MSKVIYLIFGENKVYSTLEGMDDSTLMQLDSFTRMINAAAELEDSDIKAGIYEMTEKELEQNKQLFLDFDFEEDDV